jgi:hypothetical protein
MTRRKRWTVSESLGDAKKDRWRQNLPVVEVEQNALQFVTLNHVEK